MLCENERCGYNKEGECAAEETIIDSFGHCVIFERWSEEAKCSYIDSFELEDAVVDYIWPESE